MIRKSLKCGGKVRRKEFLGADGAVMAAATLAAAGMTTAATINAAKQQAKSTIDAANTQAETIKQQTANNNSLQKESINFTRQQNQENRQQQQDIQTTLQMLAGQENVNNRMEAKKMQVKYGGRPKRKSLKSKPSYGGANNIFKVTDGGGVLPIQTDENGYGLYELIGNDHEHYHKAQGGKNKTGVGIKFANGEVVEGEGNQNTNQGELMYVTPNDALFLSKHSIDGFNPTEAVKNGVHPEEAYNIQEILKMQKGLNDDGSKAKCGARKSIKRVLGGLNMLDPTVNLTQLPSNGNAGITGGAAFIMNNQDNTSPVAKCGKRVSIKRHKAAIGDGFNIKDALITPYVNYSSGGENMNFVPQLTSLPTPLSYNSSVNLTPNNAPDISGLKSTVSQNSSNSRGSLKSFGNYSGAVFNAVGNLGGAALNAFGNWYAGRKLSNAYTQAGNILADAYSKMKGIDLDEIAREDYDAPHTLAVIRSADTNINPQLERIRRNSNAETREINRGTLSSAARQQRLAGTNDRMMQRMSEQYAYKHNADEQIKQGNAERITQTAQANADRDVQARKDWGNQRLALLQYNNDIENAKIAGIGQSRADAVTQSTIARATAAQNSLGAIGNALAVSGQGFASTADGIRKTEAERTSILINADTDNQINYLTQNTNGIGNRQRALNLYNAWKSSTNNKLKGYAEQLAIAYNFN